MHCGNGSGTLTNTALQKYLYLMDTDISSCVTTASCLLFWELLNHIWFSLHSFVHF